MYAHFVAQVIHHLFYTGLYDLDGAFQTWAAAKIRHARLIDVVEIKK